MILGRSRRIQPPAGATLHRSAIYAADAAAVVLGMPPRQGKRNHFHTNKDKPPSEGLFGHVSFSVIVG
jgi:hypothetical protein